MIQAFIQRLIILVGSLKNTIYDTSKLYIAQLYLLPAQLFAGWGIMYIYNIFIYIYIELFVHGVPSKHVC